MGERREALEAAFEELEADEEVSTPDKEDFQNEPLEEGAEGESTDGKQEPAAKKDPAAEATEDGKEKSKKSGTDKTGKLPEAGQKKEKTDPALERAAQAAAGGDGTKPPISWKPEAKAVWDKLPLDVKQDVVRREKEIQQYISQNDHHRKFTEGFQQVTRPFAHLIQAQGSTPLAAVKNLMSTAAGLTVGTAQQKAAIVAEIIGNYGVDIATLDDILSGKGGQPVAHQNGAGAISPQLAQMLQPVMGFMNEVQQAKQQRQERMQYEAVQLVEENSTLPYFDDLREDMADLMDMAAKRGVEMTIDQAYDKAVALNPEIASELSKKIASQEAKRNGGTRLANKRRASSTISGAPSGGGDGKKTPTTRREALEAAFDDAE